MSGVTLRTGERTTSAATSSNCEKLCYQRLFFLSCTFKDDCEDSDWLSIPDDLQQKMISHKVSKDPDGQVRVTTGHTHTHTHT